MREIATGLRFPEGPIAMADGSVVLVEIARGTLSRVTPSGQIEVIAELGGGPNGAAMGPDGAIYVCNNGGFSWNDANGRLVPSGTPDDYSGGRIERVDLGTGQVEVLYRECDGLPLNGPNDIVFDTAGGMWFTDLGKTYDTYRDTGVIYYAKADGSAISRQITHRETPNGIGLSPDGQTLYFAETVTGRLWAYAIESPGQIATGTQASRLLVGLPGYQLFDSLAVDAEGNVCVATLVNGGITCVSPDGRHVEHIPTDDPLTTNICFGGADLRTAYITLSSSGRLVAVDWPRAGLPLNFLNR
ncbi:MAG: SMP-30/gluconolactonase/LRE family protein [Pseudomonadales bacterium]